MEPGRSEFLQEGCTPTEVKLSGWHRTTVQASWRSGYAADCKSVYTGSIPVLASKCFQ